MTRKPKTDGTAARAALKKIDDELQALSAAIGADEERGVYNRATWDKRRAVLERRRELAVTS